MTSRFWASRWLENISGRLPLAVKLPLLLSGILAVVLGIAMIATYQVLRGTALDRAHDRVQRATRQLALQSATTIAVQQQPRYARVANDSLVRRALRGERVDVSRALASLSVETDSGTPVELWTRDGRRVAFVGNDLQSTMTVAPGRPELPEHISRGRGADARQPRGDSIQYGPLYGEGSRVHFWIVMPVRERGRDIGYIAHQRRIVQNPATMRTLRDLAGDSVTLYYRNMDGSFWASAGGFPLATHAEADT